MLKKLTKKITAVCALLLSVTMICSSMHSCSGNGASVSLDPKNPTSVTIWHYYHGAQKNALDDAIKEFNETVGHTKGIIVEGVSYSGVAELAAAVRASAQGDLDAGNMPDIFGAYGDTAFEIVNMGAVAEIDSYLSESELSEYVDSFIREGRIGTDKLYIFPIAKATDSLMINKTDFDAFVEGLKSSDINETVSYDDLSTWEGVLRVADIYYQYTASLSPDANGGKALLGIDYLANYLIVGSKQLGQDIIKANNGNVTVNLDESIMSKLWYTYYGAMVTGRFAKNGRFCSDDIKTGDTLCYIGSTSSANYFPAELKTDDGIIKDIEMTVLPMPFFENGDKVSISQGAGMVVTKSTKEKEYASVAFLKWFTEPERNVSFSLNSSYLPVKKKALEGNLLNVAFDTIQSDNIEAQNTIKALKTGIEQMKNYNLYSQDVAEGNENFRKILEESLLETVQEDRATYLTMLENGFTPEDAYAVLAEQSELKFRAWLDSLRR